MNFERRRPGEMTPEYLGRILESYLGLPEMAARARLGHFDDFFAPEEVADGMEILRLYNELEGRSMGISAGSPQYQRIKEVQEAVKNGEFDATKEESDRWAASEDGQETFRMLLEGR